MTVLSVTALTIKPDRYEDFLATTKKSKSILEKCGAKNVRLIVGMTASHREASCSPTKQMISPTPVAYWTSSFPIRKAWR